MIITLKQQSTYIYSIEGKDVYNKILGIKSNKKFKAVLDYSLEAMQLDTVAKSVYKNKKQSEGMFYLMKNKKGRTKQYTNKIINLTFKYNVKDYNLLSTKEKEYYVALDSNLDSKSIKKIKFNNGIYKNEDKIVAIEINAKTDLKSSQLPQGFGVYNGQIYLTSTGIENIANTDKIREKLYEEGFQLKTDKEIIKYVRFKRSSGSSRVGKCLFIDERLYNDILEWSMMGLKFEETDEIDLAAIEAYIALTTSSIIDAIQINPKNILLINDFESKFKDKVMVTEIVQEDVIDDNGKTKKKDVLHTEPREITITNNIWDGQSLLDSSLFGNAPEENIQWVNGKYADKGMLLLRNRFFKSACFNCNIQKFFKDNNITEISQLNGKTLATSIEEIKLITTPSSIKYLKFGNWEDFINQCTDSWGVVKYDKSTHYFDGKMVQIHYQLLNTLQLSKQDIKELLKDSIDYIELLKNDDRVFRLQLNLQIKEKEYFGDFNNNEELILTLLSLNEDFYKTDFCNDFKRDLIDSYIKNLKRGHVLVHGNYSVLFGNGLEMLQSSCGLFDGKTSLLDIDEVYCNNFDLETQLIGSRSPHITMSNIWTPKNTNQEKVNKLNKYFNSSKQIIHINSIGTNVLERLSSADFDSDQLLLSDNKLLVGKAMLNQDKFLVSTSAVNSQKIFRQNNAKQKCELDIKTSKNLIGEIVNTSAYLNSMLWEKINQGLSVDNEEVQFLYRYISQLNIMSCIEIDKAKKEYSIDNQFELDRIREICKIDRKPLFFSFLEKERLDKENRKHKKIDKKRPTEFRRDKKKVKTDKYRKYECSLDYLYKELNTIKRMKNREDVPTMWNLLSEGNWKYDDANRKQIDNIINKLKEYKKEIKAIWNNDNKENKEKFEEVKLKKEDLIDSFKSLDIKEITIRKIIKDLSDEQKNRKIKKSIKELERRIKQEKNSYKLENLNKELIKKQKMVLGKKERFFPLQRILLFVLFKTQRDSFIDIFKRKQDKIRILEYTEDNNNESEVVKIYGMNYINIK